MRLLTFALFVIFPPAAAQASIFCPVKTTPDGFVALRAAPGTEARTLTRVPAGEDVQIDDTRKARAGWQPVIYWGPERKLKITGWMSARLIEQECG